MEKWFGQERNGIMVCLHRRHLLSILQDAATDRVNGDGSRLGRMFAGELEVNQGPNGVILLPEVRGALLARGIGYGGQLHVKYGAKTGPVVDALHEDSNSA